MRLAKTLRYGIILSIIILLTGTYPGIAAPVQQDPVWVITVPAEDSILSGEVAIQGTVTHPNFVSYAIYYAPGSNVSGATTWDYTNPIAFNVQTMVVNDTLATWDTTTLPNGSYVLALAVWNSGSDTPDVYFTTNLTIQNEEATPTPEPTDTPVPTTAPAEPGTPGETEAPVVAPTVEQPPTSTPRPTPTLSPVTPGEEDTGTSDTTPFDEIISVEKVKETFTQGAQLAFIAYILGGMYFAIKAAVRYFLRSQRKNQRP